MSWDVTLHNPQSGEIVTVDSHEDGGTYALGGTTEAWLNITWNYGKCYAPVMDGQGLRKFLDSKRAGDVIKGLEMAVRALGTDRSSDYWQATNGNAGYALSILLRWARQYPDAIFDVD